MRSKFKFRGFIYPTQIKSIFEVKGVIIVKENISKKGFVYDTQDESITRTDKMFKSVFSQSGLTLLKTMVQTNFPEV